MVGRMLLKISGSGDIFLFALNRQVLVRTHSEEQLSDDQLSHRLVSGCSVFFSNRFKDGKWE